VGLDVLQKGSSMKFRISIILAALVLSACETSTQLPPVSQIKPSVAAEGSLANVKLIADTTIGLQKTSPDSNINSTTKILKFIIQQPIGTPGQRAWREMWIVDPEAENKSYVITFKEDGLNAADFEISGM